MPKVNFTIDPSVATWLGAIIALLYYIQNGTIPQPPGVVTPDSWHVLQAWCGWVVSLTIPLTALFPGLSSAKVGPLSKADPSTVAKALVLFILAGATLAVFPHSAFAASDSMSAMHALVIAPAGWFMAVVGALTVCTSLVIAWAHGDAPAGESNASTVFVAGIALVSLGVFMLAAAWNGWL